MRIYMSGAVGVPSNGAHGIGFDTLKGYTQTQQTHMASSVGPHTSTT